MAALESGSHRRDIADAFEGIVHAAISHVDDKLLNRPAVLLRADEIRGTQTLGHFEFVRVGIDTMIRLAFAITKPWITLRPMPKPKTAAVEPALTFAVFRTAPIPVVIPHPSRQTFSKGAAGFILATAISGNNRVFGKCRGAHIVVNGFPLLKNATCHPASRFTCVVRIAPHRLVRPERQNLH